jgi:hypothetical protein
MAFAERKGLEHVWLFKRSDENCLRRSLEIDWAWMDLGHAT